MPAPATSPVPVLLWLRPVPTARPDVSVLDDLERARLVSLVDPREQLAYAAHHVLARRVLSEVAGVAPGGLCFDRTCPACGGQHGRPQVVDHPGLRVSLSRTRNLLAVALARVDAVSTVQVGVDVETESRTDFEGFAEVALHPSERAQVEGGSGVGRLRRRAVAWARKEAALKAAGPGLALDPADVRIPLSGIPAAVGEPATSVWVRDVPTRRDGAVCAVAATGPLADVEVR